MPGGFGVSCSFTKRVLVKTRGSASKVLKSGNGPCSAASRSPRSLQ